MKKVTIATRSYMARHEGENLGWCRPFRSDNGRVALTYAEGVLASLEIDGEEIDAFDPHDKAREDLWERVCRASTEDEYILDKDARHYTWSEIALMDCLVECGCSSCPWFGMCDAMSDEISVFGNETAEYSDDEIIDSCDEED